MNVRVKAMGYDCIGEEDFTHSLFDFVEKVVPHKKFLVGLNDFADNYRCLVEVFNQDKICSETSKIPRGSFMNDIKVHKIFFSHLNDNVNLLYELSPSEIRDLIGADVAGKLHTGKMKQLESG